MKSDAYRYEISWEQNMGGGRGLHMCLTTDDHEAGRLAWRTLCADKLENEVRSVQVTCNGQPFDPMALWPRPVRLEEARAEATEALAQQAARVIEAAGILLPGRIFHPAVQEVIVDRARVQLTDLWLLQVERTRLVEPVAPKEIVEIERTDGLYLARETMRSCEKLFWDAVARHLHPEVICEFTALYDETLNAFPDEHNVHVSAKPTLTSKWIIFDLKCPAK